MNLPDAGRPLPAASLALPLLLAVVLLAAPGCFAVYRAGMPFIYRTAALPAAQVLRDVPYRDDGDPVKHRLNLFLPARAGGWPTVVFVHGGGWDSGDRDYTFAGRDIYNNIGRYLAANGVGAAVISYRLLPEVPWTAQYEDVATAVAWVYRHVGAYGGNAGALFLMGHSAGAHLASRVALDPAPLRDQGLSTAIVCGVIAASGAGYDMRDAPTYDLGADFGYLARRFGATDPAGDWPRAASTTPFAGPSAPPFLIFMAEGEPEPFHRQALVLKKALQAAGGSARLVVVPVGSHAREVPALSRDDQVAGPAVLAFVRETPCK